MSKFTFFVLCVVAASLSRAYANEEESKAAFREAIKPIIDACSKEHEVSNDEIEAAKTAGSADAIKPCFLGCVYKKAEILNADGEYDVDTALIKLQKYVPDKTKYAQFAEIGKKCASVNEKPVNDGAAGCERGALLTACFLENKGEISKAQSLSEVLKPIIEECSKEHGVTDADIQAAKDAGSVASIKSCFIGCVFKKAGFINDKGDYDPETGLKNLRKFVKDNEQYNKLAEVAHQCSSVNDKVVSDGTAGCERGVQIVECFLKHGTHIII